MALTETAIRKAKPGAKPQRLFDGGGLYLEVTPSGGKWWRLKFRFGGKEKLLSMGTYPDTGLKEARQRRDDARKLIAEGTDPALARKADKAAKEAEAFQTLEAVARAWLAHRADAWVERTRGMILASLENNVFPKLGARPIAEIQPGDIRALVQGIEKRGAGETAGRVFQRLRSIFRYAVAHELVATDPTYPLKPAEIFKPRKVEHRAALAERDVPEFLQRLAAYEGDPTTAAALTLLMLTAVRPGELRGAQWAEIDLENALWRVPAARMKMKTEHTVPLSKQARAALKAVNSVPAAAEVMPSGAFSWSGWSMR